MTADRCPSCGRFPLRSGSHWRCLHCGWRGAVLCLLVILMLCAVADAYAIRATRIVRVGNASGAAVAARSAAVNSTESLWPPQTPALVRSALSLRGEGAVLCQVCFKNGVSDALHVLGLGPLRKRTPAPLSVWALPQASFPVFDGRYIKLNMSRVFQVWDNDSVYVTHRDNVTRFAQALNGTTIRYYVA